LSEFSSSVEVWCLEAKSENVVSLVKETKETDLGVADIDSSILGGVGAGVAPILAAGSGVDFLRVEIGVAVDFLEVTLRVSALVEDFLGELEGF
jgi:hypothetical protein